MFLALKCFSELQLSYNKILKEVIRLETEENEYKNLLRFNLEPRVEVCIHSYCLSLGLLFKFGLIYLDHNCSISKNLYWLRILQAQTLNFKKICILWCCQELTKFISPMACKADLEALETCKDSFKILRHECERLECEKKVNFNKTG